MKKVFAQMMQKMFGKFFYIDAETEFFSKKNNEWLKKCLPEDKSIYDRIGYNKKFRVLFF